MSTLPPSGNKQSGSKGSKRSLLFSAFTNFKSSHHSRSALNEKNCKKAISFSYFILQTENSNNNSNQQEQKFDSLKKLIE